MTDSINQIVIVGGGSAGWLTAAIIAAEYETQPTADPVGIPLAITLIESPSISTIGVGEGTWPSMRTTLQKIGITETEFISRCDASFKQGTAFRNWHHSDDSGYVHPFTPPLGYEELDLAGHWLSHPHRPPFAEAVGTQAAVSKSHLAPKQITTPEYAFNVNYGYHLNAGKFAQLLQEHCVQRLGVHHVRANVIGITSHENGDIKALQTDTANSIPGDLFIDCSGMNSLLLGTHYNIPFHDVDHILFNNSAIAAQIDYQNPTDPIESCTLSTAHSAGWIWDIGLPTRRGIGCVYSDQFMNRDQAAAKLKSYIASTVSPDAGNSAALREIRFNPGYRQKFWHRNCVAVGMAAGFIEPLEASALVMVELSANMIATQLPADRSAMQRLEQQFNAKFEYRWHHIIEFLKLHYVLNERSDSDYWVQNRAASSIPDGLQTALKNWQHRGPWHHETQHADDLFPSASYQYVLYGMGFAPQPDPRLKRRAKDQAHRAMALFKENEEMTRQLLAALPDNRSLIDKVGLHGFPKI
ncbi:MAG: tryptophan halogenase family protein [Pseudomonadales bacterium]